MSIIKKLFGALTQNHGKKTRLQLIVLIQVELLTYQIKCQQLL